MVAFLTLYAGWVVKKREKYESGYEKGFSCRSSSNCSGCSDHTTDVRYGGLGIAIQGFSYLG